MIYRFFITFALSVSCIQASENNKPHYDIKILKGKELEHLVPLIAQKGIEHYREYPYLFEGNLSDVLAYLNWLITLPHTAAAIAYYQNTPIGFALGTALLDYAQEIYPQNFEETMATFRAQGKEPKQYYYITENIVFPEHNELVLTGYLLKKLEEYGSSQEYTFSSVAHENHKRHPLKPENYQELDNMWNHFGYHKSRLKVRFRWRTLQPAGLAQDQEHTLIYWLKKIGK